MPLYHPITHQITWTKLTKFNNVSDSWTCINRNCYYWICKLSERFDGKRHLLLQLRRSVVKDDKTTPSMKRWHISNRLVFFKWKQRQHNRSQYTLLLWNLPSWILIIKSLKLWNAVGVVHYLNGCMRWILFRRASFKRACCHRTFYSISSWNKLLD